MNPVFVKKESFAFNTVSRKQNHRTRDSIIVIGERRSERVIQDINKCREHY